MTQIWTNITERNPYHWSAFKVACMPPEVIRKRTVNQYIQATAAVAESAPGELMVEGKEVRPEDVTAAREIIMSPRERIVQELLEHLPEAPQAADVTRLKTSFADDGAPVINLSFLQLLAGRLIEEYLADDPGVLGLAASEDFCYIPPFARGSAR